MILFVKKQYFVKALYIFFFNACLLRIENTIHLIINRKNLEASYADPFIDVKMENIEKALIVYHLRQIMI